MCLISLRRLEKGKRETCGKYFYIIYTANCPLVYVAPSRAYGAVYKAMHKESGQLLAIKQVPVDADLQDIIKEISIMQQCDR